MLGRNINEFCDKTVFEKSNFLPSFQEIFRLFVRQLQNKKQELLRQFFLRCVTRVKSQTLLQAGCFRIENCSNKLLRYHLPLIPSAH